MVPQESNAERASGERSRFSCRSVPMPGCVHVMPRGELDIAAVPLLDHSLRAAAESDNDVVLDLRELDFIDSSGAHLLIASHRRIRGSGGRLRIIMGSGEVAWLLQLVGIDRELDVIEPRAARRVNVGRPAGLLRMKSAAR